MTNGTGTEPLGLCVVANIARETTHGEGGLEIRAGLRHFAPGAKVWIPPLRWDGGAPSITVVGRHRGKGRRYVSMAVNQRHLENFRVQAVYSPALLAALGGGPLWTEETAEAYVGYRAVPTLTARVEVVGEAVPRWVPSVTDPPPMELELEGRTYYLAFFNAHRARYSPLPPPVEPSL